MVCIADSDTHIAVTPYPSWSGGVAERMFAIFGHSRALVHRERWAEVREEVLGELAGMIERVLSRVGLLLDHIHLTLGCPIEVAPAEVVLTFLNNLAFVHRMKRVFQFGAYVGDVWRVPSGSGRE